ncbi:hypothetical protein JAAARDRAFT_279742 [Jaapia argillacea MUCL 33604]|uniref:Uncharacterized protein n=1 Tax=Jaapia argillacea MUCL 33604 TaxID=933084 RepID=A0A067Q0I2_9AGAM|nr:hypothetical protein JAAARDRAFT_279742 [Jaapia argillacea MUCL 33604]
MGLPIPSYDHFTRTLLSPIVFFSSISYLYRSGFMMAPLSFTRSLSLPLNHPLRSSPSYSLSSQQFFTSQFGLDLFHKLHYCHLQPLRVVRRYDTSCVEGARELNSWMHHNLCEKVFTRQALTVSREKGSMHCSLIVYK